MSDDPDDWVTVEGVRYVPEAPLKAKIARLRAALEALKIACHEHRISGSLDGEQSVRAFIEAVLAKEE